MKEHYSVPNMHRTHNYVSSAKKKKNRQKIRHVCALRYFCVTKRSSQKRHVCFQLIIIIIAVPVFYR